MAYVLRRVGQAILVLVLAYTAAYLLLAALPGDAIIARFKADPEYLKYIVMKGPVCVDGISLTVMGRDEESFSVSLVQYTQEHTNLRHRKPGDRINLETDIFARYIDQLLEAREAAKA